MFRSLSFRDGSCGDAGADICSSMLNRLLRPVGFANFSVTRMSGRAQALSHAGRHREVNLKDGSNGHNGFRIVRAASVLVELSCKASPMAKDV